MSKNSKIIFALGLSCFLSLQEGHATYNTPEQKRHNLVEMIGQLNFGNANDTQLMALAQSYLIFLHSVRGELGDLGNEINASDIIEALKYIKNGKSSDGRTVSFDEIEKYYKIVSRMPGHSQIKAVNDWLTGYERHMRRN
ncbi:MAG: hypothetical protein BGO77_03285 [Caedibacter sp. 37-49]|nr:MAG: hypothetical protein BGO77_03285 [Caedibacter sp. 37-49]